MSVYCNTLGSVITDAYINNFIAEIQQPGIVEQLMKWNAIEEDTNFGKLLHKEGLWSLYQYKEEKSLVYHLCRETYGRIELRNSPCQPENGRCIVCAAEAPDEIKGLWTLHNFEWIQQNGGEIV